MVNKVIAGLLIFVGIIHLLPVSGLLSAERITALYGISAEDPNLAILMRHRAVLFGLLGAFLIYAAFRPALQLVALMAGAVSVFSFLLLAWEVGNFNSAIAKIVLADLIAGAALVIAAGLYAFRYYSSVGPGSGPG
ncbi:MAG: hypothetical protein ACXIUL_03645 [Wenzhouxiangella sp.]